MESAPASARLVTVTIPGPAGPLEGLLRLPPRPAGAAVVAHPHPRLGGTMHTKVVHRVARLLADAFGLASLRFNFRGVGASAGLYDGGPGETEDLVAAAAWFRPQYPSGPFVVAGFSFGAICALHAARRLSPDILFLVGVPVGRSPDLRASRARAASSGSKGRRTRTAPRRRRGASRPSAGGT